MEVSGSFRPSRRQLLAGGVAAATAASLGGRWLNLVDRAYAAEPTACAPLSDIEHVVFVMQENRSFDHYFGTYPGVRGFGDPHVVRQADGTKVFKQKGYDPATGKPDKDGVLPPWHLDTKALNSFAECVDDITHDWAPQHHAWNGGRMDRWLAQHLEHDGADIGTLTMGYYQRKDLDFYYALADAFTLCDGYHCSVLGPTDPNRTMWFSATVDPEGKHGGPCLETLTDTRPEQFGKFTWRTMPENLQEAGVSWKVYQDASALTLLNPLLYFKNYLDDATLLGKNAHGLFNYPAEFAADVQTGKLPEVSWVFPDFAACEHPAAPPILGEAFIAQVLETLVSNPAVWEKTALFVMYDENGGFFDHVPPPTPPKGTAGEWVTADPLPADAGGVRGPVGLGFRVPMLVISPYSRGGFVSSEVFDHTSQLKFLETRFGVDVPNLSAWRRKTVGDLTGAFNFDAHRRTHVPALPRVPTAEDTEIVAVECAANGLPGTVDDGVPTPVPEHPSMPHQEAGTRRRPSGLPKRC